MRGIAFALVAFAATMPAPLAAQCYGPECDLRRYNAPAYYDERPNFHSHQTHGQPYRPAPYEQAPAYRLAPYQGQPHHPAPYQGQPYRPMPQSHPAYRQPAYQAQPRPRVTYSSVPPGVAPRGSAHQPGVRTRITKFSKPTPFGDRQQQFAPDARTGARSGSRPASAGQITISVAEYRDLQNQARELQRLLGARAGAPNGPSPFPDVRLPEAGNAPRQ